MGEGNAVIAHVRAQALPEDDCTEPPIDIGARPHGAECREDEDCVGGCASVPVLASDEASFDEQICGKCEVDAHCGGDQVCGLAWDDGWYGMRTCMDAGDKLLGEACVSDTECGTGICNEGQCSECTSNDDCEDGICARPDTTEGTDLLPHQCDPEGGDREPGAACLSDGDCASGSCEAGTYLKICDPDGRTCQTDDDCPWAELGGTCEIVGRKDGVCG